MKDRVNSIAGTISHGEQRQLEIAMTLATEPQVLLLDEPLAGMGTVEAERMVALLLTIKKDHGILLVEHDMDAVFALADRLTARTGTRGQRDWTYERVLDTFPRLKERLNHGGQQLSGGEQQMLTIGRALLTNPDVLILDEATEGLAPLIAREIWRICALIRESGISSVIVDKNWKHVTQITDRNVILVKGAVVFEGSLAELHAQPALLQQYLGV